MKTFLFKKLNPAAKIPVRSMHGDAGHDVTSIENIVLAPGETKAILTGLALADYVTDEPATQSGQDLRPLHVIFKEGATGTTNAQRSQEINFIKVEGRSGLALRGIFPVGGIIDPGYRGEIKIILHNSSPNAYTVLMGDRIAQLIVYSAYCEGAIAELPEGVEATKTERGESGFGSTGQ